MKKFIYLLLALSCTANIWLLIRGSASRRDAMPPVTRLADLPPKDQAIRSASATMALTRVGQDEPEITLKKLRAAGADNETTRAVLDGALRRKHRAAMAARRIEAFRTGWWKPVIGGAAETSDLRSLVTEPLKKLLGPDPLDLVDAAARYDFLPPEKRRLLALIDLDYGEMQAPRGRDLAGVVDSQATTKGEAAEERLLLQERRKDLLATLTPEERREYELRFGGTAEHNALRLARLDVSESEFRALKPIVDAYQEAMRTARAQSKGVTSGVGQRTVDEIAGALGYDRALDYLWSGLEPYENLTSLMRELNQPTGNAARVFQLAAETGERAAAIHYDSSLTTDQKKAALLALQGSVRPQLDALVPPSGQSKLPDLAIGWFKRMSDGRYERMYPMIFGNVNYFWPHDAVTTPVTGPAPKVPVVRAPGK